MDYKIIFFFFILLIFIILFFIKNEIKIINYKWKTQIIFLLLILFSSLLIWSINKKNKEGMKIELLNIKENLNEESNEVLKVRHRHVQVAGFFSGCSVKLYEIINYFNNFKKLPKDVDSSELFLKYKYDNKTDITYDFFEHYDNRDFNLYSKKYIDIDYNCYQFNNYKLIDYDSITPYIDKYFYPSKKIINIYNDLIDKYNIDTDNCIGLYYRGTDKYKETPLDSFESYYQKLKELTKNNSKIQILIQTDSTPFLEYMKDKCFNKNIIIIKENSTSSTNKGIHFEKSNSENYKDMKNLFATFLIISKCKYIICSSGNCSVWIMFYRNNAKNVHQNLNKEWL